MSVEYQKFIELKKRALEKVFARMNEKQREAVFQINGPLLILAGAGSGKTTVVVNRIANMIKFGNGYQSTAMPEGITGDDLQFLEGFAAGRASDEARLVNLCAFHPVRPWNILAITFTNKAAGELKDRLVAMLGEDANDIQASTFHSACVRILRRDIDKIGYDRKFGIYDSDDSQRVVKEALKNLQADDKMFTPKSVAGAISRMKDELKSPEQALDEAGNDYRRRMIARVYAEYQKTLRSNTALDFDDIIGLTVRLFRENPEVLSYYQNRFRYIMVDEYQDTNHAQFTLVEMLSRQYKNICVVGDDDQSIYKFRGANIENILNFEEQFEDTKVIRLEQNYRSTQNILDAANSVIAHNTERKGKTLWTDNAAGDKVYWYHAQDEQGEAMFIGQTILDDVAKGAKFSDHAVLYRMNALSNNLEKYFVRTSIPYRIIGGHRFYERKEIKDVLAYLQIINNPADDVRLKRIINEPKRGIGDTTVEAAQRIADGLNLSLFEVMSHAKDYADLSRRGNVLEDFCRMLQELMDRADTMPLYDLLEAVLNKSTYRTYLKAQGEEGAARLENVDELMTNIKKYCEENDEPSLSGFLEEVSLFTDMDNYDPDADCVTLMTVHSAKGLEFPYVFIDGMEDNLFPGMQSMFNAAEMEEERRLAYVAITRAKKKLYITNAQTRMLYGTTQRNRPSQFLREIPESLLDCEDAARIVSPTQISRPSAKSSGAPTRAAQQFGVGGMKRPTASAHYTVGQTVRHKTFGTGIILNVTPMGNDSLLEIAFDTAGTKKLMSNFARLEIVG